MTFGCEQSDVTIHCPILISVSVFHEQYLLKSKEIFKSLKNDESETFFLVLKFLSYFLYSFMQASLWSTQALHRKRVEPSTPPGH